MVLEQAQQTSKCPLNILIIGAGLAGLSAAISCTLAGHHVLIVESAPELVEIGGGVAVTPNATKLFVQYGIYDKLQKSACEPVLLEIHRYSDGTTLAKEEDFNGKMKRKYGGALWGLHRADLQMALADRARQLGVTIRVASAVADINFDKPSVKLESGEELQADLVVAGDGLWSRSRQAFLAVKGTSEGAPLPTGDLAYRISLKVDEVFDPELKRFLSTPKFSIWLGPGAHVAAYPIRGGSMYTMGLLVADDLPPNVSRQPGSKEEMRELFASWDPFLRRILDQVKLVDKWKLMHRPELDHWIDDQANFVFIGDACHPMLPYLAQGANSSMEDGAVLGHTLAALEFKSQLPEALQLYERLRKQRGEAIVRETFVQQRDSHMDDGPEQQARDELMLKYLGKPIDCRFPHSFLCAERQPWLFGYDTLAATDAGLKETPYGKAP